MFPLLMDLPMGLISLLLGLYFFRSNGKAASLLSGYNTKSVKEREKVPLLRKKNDHHGNSVSVRGCD